MRVAIAESIARRLGSADDLCVLAAGEAYLGVGVPNVPEATSADAQALAGCFDGGDHGRWLGPDGVGQLSGQGVGRATLWSGVSVALDVLANHATVGVEDHILVLSDGPDTCSGEALTNCEPDCVGALGVDQLNDRLAAAGSGAPRIDFIQFQPPGYPDRDVRQLAIACASGGQHLFIDHAAGLAASGALWVQLKDAIAAVVASWDGVWRFSVELPAVGSGAALPSGTPPEALYALRGELVLGAGLGFVSAEQRYPIGIEAIGGDAPAGATWDRRLVFRNACAGAGDCGAGGEPADSCVIACSAETLLCAVDPGEDPRSDGASCAGGTCCAGVCSASGTCCE